MVSTLTDWSHHQVDLIEFKTMIESQYNIKDKYKMSTLNNEVMENHWENEDYGGSIIDND